MLTTFLDFLTFFSFLIFIASTTSSIVICFVTHCKSAIIYQLVLEEYCCVSAKVTVRLCCITSTANTAYGPQREIAPEGGRHPSDDKRYTICMYHATRSFLDSQTLSLLRVV